MRSQNNNAWSLQTGSKADTQCAPGTAQAQFPTQPSLDLAIHPFFGGNTARLLPDHQQGIDQILTLGKEMRAYVMFT